MEGLVLVWLFCLQGCLLVSTLNCADKGALKHTDEYRRECLGWDTTKALLAELTEGRSLAPSGAWREPEHVQLAARVRRQTDSERKRKLGVKRMRPGGYSTLGIVQIATNTEAPKVTPPPSRVKRQLERERDRHKKLLYPGGTSMTGQPMRLMLAERERERRQLPAPKKKPKKKPRVGSFSLLSHRQPTSLQVIRARRQLQNAKKKKKRPTGKLGQYSVLSDPSPNVETQRSKRNLQPKKKKAKKAVCP
ncbi:hypothetical protein SKAU_G00073340 [Synaphobranchus kaupii]|uniref:Uncharacterized protein n=1 Tax=Synaphobranchus kaupii TaxID=118154 RepID=A0A9Q1J9R1_SYNKA|nr:hypothetical protein SKAU_G00073340 [Synaphobranchus kaupii]